MQTCPLLNMPFLSQVFSQFCRKEKKRMLELQYFLNLSGKKWKFHILVRSCEPCCYWIHLAGRSLSLANFQFTQLIQSWDLFNEDLLCCAISITYEWCQCCIKKVLGCLQNMVQVEFNSSTLTHQIKNYDEIQIPLLATIE